MVSHLMFPKMGGTPKPSILIYFSEGFPLINHPAIGDYWDIPIYGPPHIDNLILGPPRCFPGISRRTHPCAGLVIKRVAWKSRTHAFSLERADVDFPCPSSVADVDLNDQMDLSLQIYCNVELLHVYTMFVFLAYSHE